MKKKTSFRNMKKMSKIKMKTNYSKRFLLVALSLFVVSFIRAQDVAYAVYADSTLTFKYGVMPSENNVYKADYTGNPGWWSKGGSIKLVVFDQSFSKARLKNCASMFAMQNKLVRIDSLQYFNTSEVTNMVAMFSRCEKLQSLDLSGFNTSKVTTMESMFYSCTALTTVDVSNFDVSKVNSMASMFCECISLTTILCNDTWICSGNSDRMFYNCKKLKGAMQFSSSKITVDYANPESGYFTYKRYNIWIAGTQVTGKNYSDLSSVDGASGTISYDIKNKTLMLDNATIAATGNGVRAIYSTDDVLNITVSGENIVTSASSSAILCVGSTTDISGNGSILAKGLGGITVSSDNHNDNTLNIRDGVQFTAEGINYGIIGNYENITTLNVAGEKTLVRFKGGIQSMKSIGQLNLGEKMAVCEPLNAYYDSTQKTVVSNGSAVKDEWVEMGLKRYGFEVGGIPVTIMNKGNITGSNIKQGTATYDDETKTLTLTDCSIGMDYTTGTIGIKSSMDSLAIHLVGNNSIGMVETGIECSRNLTIAGPGKLDMMLCGTGIAMTDKTYKAELAICDDAKLSMVLVGTGIVGTYVDKPGHVFFQKDLRISGGNSDVDIIASQSAVSDMNVLTLNDGIALSAPVGAKYSGGDVLDKDGNLVQNKKVRFSHLGDVNNDGAVTMADANAVVNYFLATDKPSNFDVDNANVNGDGDDDGKPSITMADANAIVNIFLGQ